jgi:N6-L-threonylcarbamoyladenine synthase
MIILGIETSCDETAAAVLKEHNNSIQIVSNVVASSASLQEKYGGVIPEQAAREQLKSIIPVIEEALTQAQYKLQDLDAISVTYGPGLIGSLLVGVEVAKTLSAIYKKPLIPINHLIGHFYANWIDNNPKFPALGLLVSGGHTDLVLFSAHNKYEYLGGTRDDAAGECFDKCARLLGLPYPGGPSLSNLAKDGNPAKFNLPIPMINSKDLDFSYSGLKTAASSLVGQLTNELERADLAASIEDTIVKSLIHKVKQALKIHPVKDLIVAGGVAANEKLKQELQVLASTLDINLHIPPANLCTDNAAMIASAAFFIKPTKDIFTIQADPNLAL